MATKKRISDDDIIKCIRFAERADQLYDKLDKKVENKLALPKVYLLGVAKGIREVLTYLDGQATHKMTMKNIRRIP